MSHLSLVRSLIVVALLFFCSVITHAQNKLLPVIFKSENGQVSFTLRKEFQPAIAEIVIQVLTLEIKEVYQQQGPANLPLVWQLKDSNGKPAQDQVYFCAIGLKPPIGQTYILTGRIMQNNGKREFSLLEERPSNLLGPDPEEFHQSLTQAMPKNGAAWFFYGLAICEKHQAGFGFSLLSTEPPPPPPPAAPALPVVVKSAPAFRISKEEEKRIAEEEKQWEAKQVALRKDLKVAQPAFLKAAELAEDCQLKDAAMSYLAAIAREFDDEAQQQQWLLKRIENPCATNAIRAESYYMLGVNQWTCTFNLTKKYENPKLQYTNPFHFRRIGNPADKQKFDGCLSAGTQYIEKALEADPNFADAMFYKSLFYRERQKVTANAVERKKIDVEANKIKDRGMELLKQREQQK